MSGTAHAFMLEVSGNATSGPWELVGIGRRRRRRRPIGALNTV